MNRESVLANVKSIRSSDHVTGVKFKPEKDSGLAPQSYAFALPAPDCDSAGLCDYAAKTGVIGRVSETLRKVEGVGRTDRVDASADFVTGNEAYNLLANITTGKPRALEAPKAK